MKIAPTIYEWHQVLSNKMIFAGVAPKSTTKKGSISNRLPPVLFHKDVVIPNKESAFL